MSFFNSTNKNSNIINFGKTTTTAISPMNISLINSTKNKEMKKICGKRTSIFRKNKLIEHKKAKMSYENFKKK